MKSSTKIRIALAEDHGMLRTAYRNILSQRTGYKVIHEAANGQELLDNMKKKAADIVLLDLDMPVMSGKEAFELIKILFPKTRTIIISAHYDQSYVSEYFYKGVNGYLSKNATDDQLFEAIDSVMEEGYYYDISTSRFLIEEVINNKEQKHSAEELNINSIEVEILKMICDEIPTKKIAEKLQLSVYAVDHHRRNILAKTEQSNLIGLFKFALRNGITKIT
ncbi:MAG: hypothetical protein K0S33_1595 [Bacteroidetes bacterium]|jgi:DNA-binding NarL/FixJ family response regulator|nr:hypothetical protein [Bacteroidota bacterium]